MNPGAAEEVGKATGTFMSIMKDQPLALALCVMNVLLLVLFFYIFKVSSEKWSAQFELTQQATREVQQLLYNCTPINKPQ